MDMNPTEQEKYAKARQLGAFFLRNRQPSDEAKNERTSLMTLEYGHPDFWFGIPGLDWENRKIGCFTDKGECLIYNGRSIVEID